MNDTTALRGRGRFHYAWVIAFLSLMVVFGALGIARFGYTVVLPSMQAGLGLDNTQAGGLATANLVGYLALCAIGGALATRYGPRAVAAGGLFVAAVSMFMTGFASGFGSAAVWRTLTGLGSGAGNIAAMGLLSAWFTKRRRGLAAGIGVSGSSVALILLGPIIPPVLSASGEGGWRLCWFGFAAVTLALAVLAMLFVRNRPEDMGLVACGEEDSGNSVDDAGKAQWGRIYRSAPVWHLGLVYAAFGFSYIIFITFFTKHLMASGGYSREAAGRLFMVMGWCSLLCGLVWGTVSDLIGRKWAMAIVYVIQAAAFAVFGTCDSPAGFTLAAVLFGVTAWSIPAIMAATCGDVLGARLAPAALGFITLFFGIGQAAGPTVAGLIADATGSFGPALLLASAVAALGAFWSAMLRPSRVRGDGAR